MTETIDLSFSQLPPNLRPPATCSDPLTWAHANLPYGAFMALGFHKIHPPVWEIRKVRINWYQSRRSSEAEARPRAWEAGICEIQAQLTKMIESITVFLEKKAAAPIAVSQPPEAEEVATLEGVDLVAEVVEAMDLVAEVPEVEMKTSEQVCILKEVGACDVMTPGRGSAIIRAISMRRTDDDGQEREQVYAPVHKPVVDVALRRLGVKKRSHGAVRFIFTTATNSTSCDCHGVVQWPMARIACEVFDGMHTVLLKTWHARALKFHARQQAEVLGMGSRPPPRPPDSRYVLEVSDEFQCSVVKSSSTAIACDEFLCANHLYEMCEDSQFVKSVTMMIASISSFGINQVLESSFTKENIVMVSENVNYQGEVPVEERVEDLNTFKDKDGDCPTLVWTGLAAGGLGWAVDRVIIFDSPANSIDASTGWRVFKEFWIIGEVSSRGVPVSDTHGSLDQAVKLLRNHTSLVLWAGGNEQVSSADINKALRNDLKMHSLFASLNEASTTPGEDFANQSQYFDGIRVNVPGSWLDSFAGGRGGFTDGPYGIQGSESFVQYNFLQIWVQS